MQISYNYTVLHCTTNMYDTCTIASLYHYCIYLFTLDSKHEAATWGSTKEVAYCRKRPRYYIWKVQHTKTKAIDRPLDTTACTTSNQCDIKSKDFWCATSACVFAGFKWAMRHWLMCHSKSRGPDIANVDHCPNRKEREERPYLCKFPDLFRR